MPKRKEFKDMTDDELTDAVIVRRVFPAAVRKLLEKAVSALDAGAGKARKSTKSTRKKR